MITWFKKYSSILRASVITALEYKANSIVGLFAIFTGLLIEYLIWSMIYGVENTSSYSIDGWTFNRLMAYIFLAMIIVPLILFDVRNFCKKFLFFGLMRMLMSLILI